jgi:hypothetical protein
MSLPACRLWTNPVVSNLIGSTILRPPGYGWQATSKQTECSDQGDSR